jgi:hypothetical protein
MNTEGATTMAENAVLDPFDPKLLRLNEVEYERKRAEGAARREQAIREWAYDFWQDAGSPDGRALEFWLAAEREYNDVSGYYDDMRAEEAEIAAEAEGVYAEAEDHEIDYRDYSFDADD